MKLLSHGNFPFTLQEKPYRVESQCHLTSQERAERFTISSVSFIMSLQKLL